MQEVLFSRGNHTNLDTVIAFVLQRLQRTGQMKDYQFKWDLWSSKTLNEIIKLIYTCKTYIKFYPLLYNYHCKIKFKTSFLCSSTLCSSQMFFYEHILNLNLNFSLAFHHFVTQSNLIEQCTVGITSYELVYALIRLHRYQEKMQ